MGCCSFTAGRGFSIVYSVCRRVPTAIVGSCYCSTGVACCPPEPGARSNILPTANFTLFCWEDLYYSSAKYLMVRTIWLV